MRGAVGAKIASSTAFVRAAALASLADIALVGAGIAAAGASAAFAALMLAGNSGEPRVNGMRYLAIFAQPNGAARREPVVAATDQRPVGAAARTIDRYPTGSINPSEASAPVADDGSHIVGGRSDLLWIRQGVTISAVRPGDLVAGLKRVRSIVRRDGGWALLDAAGATLLATNSGDPLREAPGRLSSRLIFN